MLGKIKKQLLEDQKNKKILITVAWVSVVFIILILAASSGGNTTASTDLNNPSEFNIGEMVFGTLIRLVLVLALIYGIFSIYKLFQKNGQGIRERRLLIIDSHRFSPKQAIMMLRVDDQELLIGVTDHQISLLKDFGHVNEQSLQDKDEELIEKKSFKDFMDTQNEA